jgi:hypothetical protein
MKLGDIIIAVVWVYCLATALYRGLMAGHVADSVYFGPPFAPGFARFLWLFTFTFFAVAGFFQRGHLVSGGGWLQKRVDGRWGAGAYAAMTMRLRPVALFMLTALTAGLTGLISNYANAQNWPVYVNSIALLSCGLGLLVAYLLSLRFPPRMY